MLYEVITHLEGPGNQAAEHADSHGTRRRMSIQMPQSRMQQCARQGAQPTVVLNGVRRGQAALEDLSHGGSDSSESYRRTARQ